jgi:DNA-binding MarR family transcriptional regulator
MSESSQPAFTPRQGQFLAFIYYYTKVNGLPPAESDMQRYFQLTAPSVHAMVKNLEAHGLIARAHGVGRARGRSIRLLVTKDALPELE